MKRLLLLGSCILLFFGSCSVRNDDYHDNQLTLHEFLRSYDLWHVNVNATRGSERIPFLQKAFTISFDANVLVANNNLVGIGSIGAGYGRGIGHFSTTDPFLHVHHDLDGSYRFKVVQISNREIELYDTDSNAVYRLEGYYKRDFDYDRLFFENISYFLQEYTSWEKTYTSRQGIANPFDNENFMRFYSLNGDYVFETKDFINRPQPIFRGLYWIDDVRNSVEIKLLTLDYGNGSERFEVRVLNDREIELFHLNSQTLYRFRGVQNIIYKDKKEDLKEKIATIAL